jgi:hypothetical protein
MREKLLSYNSNGPELNFSRGRYGWKALVKAGLIFVMATGAFLTLKAIGSFSILSSWLKRPLLKTGSDRLSILMNPNDSLISEETPISCLIRLADFKEVHLIDSVAPDIKTEWLGTQLNNAVVNYIENFGKGSWQCQAGLMLGTAGALVMGNPLLFGIGAVCCVSETDAATPIVLNPIANQTAFTGKYFNFPIPANAFNDADGDTLSYNITLADGNPLPAWLTTDKEMTPVLLGSLGTYCAYGVASKGNLAVVADYIRGLKNIDVSNPYAPVLVGSLDTCQAEDVALNRNLAVVADREAGIKNIDNRDPADPVLIGSSYRIYNTYTGVKSAKGVAINGNFTYVAGIDGGLGVLNIGNPYNPVLTGSFIFSQAYEVAENGNLAHVASSSGLKIFDTSDPTNPVLIGSSVDSYYAEDVCVNGDFTYVADRDGGLKNYDTSNPFAPSLIGGIGVPSQAFGIAGSDGMVYIATSYGGLQIIDNRDPSNPVSMGSIATNWGNKVVVNDDLGIVIVADSAGIKIFGGMKFTPVIRGMLDSASTGDYDIKVTVDDGNGGQISNIFTLHVQHAPTVANPIPDQSVNVGEPFSLIVPANTFNDTEGNPLTYMAALVNDEPLPGWLSFNDTILELIGTPQTGDAGRLNIKITADDGKGGWVSDLFTLRVQHAPTVANPIPDQSASVGQLFDFLVPVNTFNDMDKNMLNYNITLANGNPLPAWLNVRKEMAPVLIGSLDTDDTAVGLRVAGDIAYELDRNSLRTIDVSNPADPVLKGSAGTSGNSRGLDVAGNFTYVADDSAGLKIYNTSDPENPVLAGSLDTPGYAYAVKAVGDVAVVAAGSNGVLTVDISDPYNMAIIGGYGTFCPFEWGNAIGLEMVGDTVYVMFDGEPISDTAFQVLDISDPANPVYKGKLDSNYVSEMKMKGNLALTAAGDGLEIHSGVNLTPMVYGTPNTTGSYDVRVTVDDGKGGTVSDVFTLKVKPGSSSSSLEPSGSIVFSPSLTSSSEQRSSSSSSFFESLSNFLSSLSESPRNSFSSTEPSSNSFLPLSSGPESGSSFSRSTEDTFNSKSKVSTLTQVSSFSNPATTASKSLLSIILGSLGGITIVITSICGVWLKYNKALSKMRQQNPFAAEIHRQLNFNISSFKSDNGKKYLNIIGDIINALEKQDVAVDKMDREELKTFIAHLVKVIKDKIKPKRNWVGCMQIPVENLGDAKDLIIKRIAKKYAKRKDENRIGLQVMNDETEQTQLHSSGVPSFASLMNPFFYKSQIEPFFFNRTEQAQSFSSKRLNFANLMNPYSFFGASNQEISLEDGVISSTSTHSETSEATSLSVTK